MKLSLNNFLYGLKNIVMGNGPVDGGILVDSKNLIGDSVLAAGVTYIADTNGYPVINAVTTVTSVAVLSFSVPRDYDEATDQFGLVLTAHMAGATDVPTVTLAPAKQTIGSAPTSMTAKTGSLSTAALSATAKSYTFDLSGNGLKRDDLVKLTFTSDAHTTDALQVLAVRPNYRSCIVSYHEFVGASNVGVPLR